MLFSFVPVPPTPSKVVLPNVIVTLPEVGPVEPKKLDDTAIVSPLLYPLPPSEAEATVTALPATTKCKTAPVPFTLKVPASEAVAINS